MKERRGWEGMEELKGTGKSGSCANMVPVYEILKNNNKIQLSNVRRGDVEEHT